MVDRHLHASQLLNPAKQHESQTTQSVDHLVNTAGYVSAIGSLRRSKSTATTISQRSFPRGATSSLFLSGSARNSFLKLGKRSNEIFEYGDYYYHADGTFGQKSKQHCSSSSSSSSSSSRSGHWNLPNSTAILPLTHRAKQIISQPLEFRRLKQAIRNRGAVTGMSLRQLVPFMLSERWEDKEDQHDDDDNKKQHDDDDDDDDEDQDDNHSTSTASTTYFDPHEQEKIFLDDLKDINESILESSSCTSSTMASDDASVSLSSYSTRDSPVTNTPEDKATREPNIICDSTPLALSEFCRDVHVMADSTRG